MKKIIFLSMIFGMLFSLVATAQNMERADPNINSYPGAIDMFNSDKLDTAIIDTYGNGHSDLTVFDFNDDGLVDAYFFDKNNDGFAEFQFFDYDSDGLPDLMGIDYDNDNYPDAWDTNLDDIVDAFDLNRDGLADAWDTNGDGTIDETDSDYDSIPDSKEIKLYTKPLPEEGSATKYFMNFLIFILIVGAVVYFFKRKGNRIVGGKAEKKVKSEIKSETKIKKNIFAFAKIEASTGAKVGALIINLLIPGLGYFLLGSNLRMKAIVLTAITLISYFMMKAMSITSLILVAVWIYAIIEVGKSFAGGK